jgi:thiol-disulfide isomerase/thioredoxin
LKKRKWHIDILLVVAIVFIGFIIYRQIFTEKAESIQEAEVQKISLASTELPVNDNVPNVSDEIVEIPAPEFNLKNLSGEDTGLTDYRGTGLVINFWATWCPPCRAEMPLFGDVADKYEESLVVLAINSGESLEQVMAFAPGFSPQIVFLLDSDNSVGDLYRVRGLPTTYFIDGDGFIQAMHIGALTEDLLAEYLKVIGIGQ